MNRRRACFALVAYSLVTMFGFSASDATAQSVIHKCTDAEGGVVYSQLPCPTADTSEQEEETDGSPEARSDDLPAGEANADSSAADRYEVLADFDNDVDSPVNAEEVAACKKPIRDAIDAIDDEMRVEYTADKAEQYKQRLLALTRELRNCEG